MFSISSSVDFCGVLRLALLSLLVCCVSAANSPPYLTKTDKDRLGLVFSTGLKQTLTSQQDLSGIHFSLLGNNLLKVSGDYKSLCGQLSKYKDLIPTDSAESYYYVVTTWEAAKCSGTLQTASIVQYLKGVVTKKDSSVSDFYYGLLALKSLGKLTELLKDPSQLLKVKSSLQAAVQADDSIQSLGQGLHAGAELASPTTEVEFIYTRIEDLLAQADEVDGKYLQFEGGLTITGLVVSGVYKLSTAVNKPPKLTADQVMKFSNYFISRKSVQSPKAAWSLLNVLQTLTTNKFQRPVWVSLEGAVTGGGQLTVRLSDSLGQSISPGSVTAVSLDVLARATAGTAVLSKVKFTQSPTDKSRYSAPLPDSSTLSPGFYKATISVSTSSPYIGGAVQVLQIKLTSQLAILDPLLIAVTDSDNFLQPKFQKVDYPGAVSSVLGVDSLQRIALRFQLKDSSTKKPASGVTQAFVRLHHTSTKQELIFVAEEDSTNTFKLDLDIGAKATEFGHTSGLYEVELLAGGPVYTNSIQWKLASVQITFPPTASASVVSSTGKALKPGHFALKPEIKHLFREPEKRPPVLVSNLFTGLVLIPLLILFILWIKLGINISNFSLRLSTLGFHLGLGSIFCLFGLFWLQLNMFETLKYLIALGLVTFLSGNKLLASLATKHKA